MTRGDERLDALLAAAHHGLGIAVYDGLMSQGGPPEPRDPDRALGLLLAAAHRQTLSAVVRRTGRRGSAAPARRPGGPGGNGLMGHPAAVRLKYREQTLRVARAHWPQELDDTVHRALEAVRELTARLAAGRPPDSARAALARAGEELERVLSLPRAPRLPAALTGYDYPELAQALLAGRAARLMDETRASLALLEAELLPRLDEEDVSFAGALEVAEDLAGDLELAYRSALSLLSAVTEAEEAGHDFRGADLREVVLDGVGLAGVRWDAGTRWPPGWEERMWRASAATDDELGVLVVGPEPHGSAVAADL
ncbi:hypothetical protein [Streptomyces sp. NPDC014894]|uniref:hypothetical protein n=1 Tax=Streptomyces sp. NPDC014894 TaxID=3364931 RepID=UPI0036F83C56